MRYPDGDPKQDPARCNPPLDYWFASDEAEAKGRCHGQKPAPPVPPPPPPRPSQAAYFQPLAAGAGVGGPRAPSCLAVDTASSQAVLHVGACDAAAEWFGAGTGADPELGSGVRPGTCMNVFNQTKGLGRCKGPGALLHLNACGGGPGNRFRYTAQQVTPWRVAVDARFLSRGM